MQIAWLNTFNEKIRTVVGSEMQTQNLTAGHQWLLSKTVPLVAVMEAEKDGASSGHPAHYLLLAGLAVAAGVMNKVQSW